ncbi:keywimysin-related RiPP [Streptomyces syringium]
MRAFLSREKQEITLASKAYEGTLVQLGTFRKKTGLLGRRRNDRLIPSKN